MSTRPLPDEYVPHLEHRVTSLLSFVVRNELGFFTNMELDPTTGKSASPHRGDVYCCAIEGAAIMFRALLEFIGLASTRKTGVMELCDYPDSDREKSWRKDEKKADAVLGWGALSGIAPARVGDVPSRASSSSPTMTFSEVLARLHDGTSKRTAHAAFTKEREGLKPEELHEAAAWLLNQIHSRCYYPDSITIHGDLCRLLPEGKWEGIPFKERNP